MMMRANARVLPRGASASSDGDGLLRCDRAGEEMLRAFWPSAADAVSLPAELRGPADGAQVGLARGDHDLAVKLVPTPREFSSDCGIALRFAWSEIDRAQTLLDAAHVDVAAGQVYNLGGGPANTLAIWTEFKPILEKRLGHALEATRSDWRPGDQMVFISDIRKAGQQLGWAPKVGVEDGIRSLFEWVKANPSLFTH